MSSMFRLASIAVLVVATAALGFIAYIANQPKPVAQAPAIEQKAREHGIGEEQIAASKTQYIAGLSHKLAEEEGADLSHVAQAFSSTFQSASGMVGTAFAQMIVQGKSWHDAFANFTKDLESQFIQMVTNMMIKWAAFTLLTGGFGASAGFASSFSGWAPHAVGMDSIVDGPTPMMVGEGGAERVQVTPLGGSGGGGSAAGGGNGSLSVSVQINAPGVVTDINAFSDMVGKSVVQQIRGQGQLQFTRNA